MQSYWRHGSTSAITLPIPMSFGWYSLDVICFDIWSLSLQSVFSSFIRFESISFSRTTTHLSQLAFTSDRTILADGSPSHYPQQTIPSIPHPRVDSLLIDVLTSVRSHWLSLTLILDCYQDANEAFSSISFPSSLGGVPPWNRRTEWEQFAIDFLWTYLILKKSFEGFLDIFFDNRIYFEKLIKVGWETKS